MSLRLFINDYKQHCLCLHPAKPKHCHCEHYSLHLYLCKYYYKTIQHYSKVDRKDF